MSSIFVISILASAGIAAFCKPMTDLEYESLKKWVQAFEQ